MGSGLGGPRQESVEIMKIRLGAGGGSQGEMSTFRTVPVDTVGVPAKDGSRQERGGNLELGSPALVYAIDVYPHGQLALHQAAHAAKP